MDWRYEEGARKEVMRLVAQAERHPDKRADLMMMASLLKYHFKHLDEGEILAKLRVVWRSRNLSWRGRVPPHGSEHNR